MVRCFEVVLFLAGAVVGDASGEGILPAGQVSGANSANIVAETKLFVIKGAAEDVDWVYNYTGIGTANTYSIWRPRPKTQDGVTYRPLGDISHASQDKMPGGVLLVGGSQVQTPTGFSLIWGKRDLRVMKPSAAPGFECIGSVGVHGDSSLPPKEVACVPQDCLEVTTTDTNVWNDQASESEQYYTSFASPIHDGYFVGERSFVSYPESTTTFKIKESCLR